MPNQSRRSDQLQRVGDGVFLEIIAEGKISEHFEKRVMAVGEADIFQVVVLAAGAHAFLAGGGAVVVALFEAEEDVLELVHSGIGEKQRGIVCGDERRAAHDAVAALFEEFQKRFADFVAGPLLCSQRCPRWKQFIIAEGPSARNGGGDVAVILVWEQEFKISRELQRTRRIRSRVTRNQMRPTEAGRYKFDSNRNGCPVR